MKNRTPTIGSRRGCASGTRASTTPRGRHRQGPDCCNNVKPSTAPLTFELQLDPAETVRATQIVLRRRPWGWTERWALPLFVAFGLLFIRLGTPWQELWLLGIVVLGLGLVQVVLPIVQRRQLRRTYADTPSLRGPQVYRFSDSGLAITGGASSTTLGWDSLVEALETEEFFLFYYSKLAAFYLPKRVTSDAGQRSALRELVRTHLGSRAAGLGGT